MRAVLPESYGTVVCTLSDVANRGTIAFKATYPYGVKGAKAFKAGGKKNEELRTSLQVANQHPHLKPVIVTVEVFL